MMDEPSAEEAGSLEEEVAGEHVEETAHDEDEGEKAPSTNKCCIRISGSAKGIGLYSIPSCGLVSHTLGVYGLFPPFQN